MGRRKQLTAAEVLSLTPMTEDPLFDAWPPASWFAGEVCRGSDGRPFDWSCPAAGFETEAAYDWVGRAESFYRHLEATDTNTSRHNGQSKSALGNAYLLVKNLRDRRLVPLGGFKIYHVPMDDCPAGFEVRELGVVHAWLGRRLSSSRRAPATADASPVGKPDARRLRTDVKAGTVTVDGKPHDVGDILAAFVQILLDNPDYMSLKKLQVTINKLLGHTSSNLIRERRKLPPDVLKVIEVKPIGHRILAEYRK